jgi:hypothetical protein
MAICKEFSISYFKLLCLVVAKSSGSFLLSLNEGILVDQDAEVVPEEEGSR